MWNTLTQKTKLFFKRNALMILAFLTVFMFLLFIIASIFVPKRISTKLSKKIDNTIDFISNKNVEYKADKQVIDAERVIKEKVADDKKETLTKELEIIKNIEDRQRRLERLIKFNKSIKVLQ